MATIRTAIELQDNFSSVLYGITNAVNTSVYAMEGLNRAMNDPVDTASVQAANEAYSRLSSTVSNTEHYIQNNTGEQEQFNRAIDEGTRGANNLMNTIKGAVAAYASIQTIGKILELSDQLTSTTARLNLMNDDLQTTQELQDMIYLSAQRSRGAYQTTADAVAKMGLMAGDAFGSSKEVIAFVEQLNKQFTIAGTSAEGIDAAMLQLTQAMGSGVLRGEEYNSIFEQAPNIIQAIANYMEVPKGELKDIAAEGEITAEIVKNAMFAAADETNAKFESMPMTFSQVWSSFQNTALVAFQPVLQRLNDVANSESFQTFVNGAIEALALVANIVIEIFDLIASVGSFIGENWSIIEPIIMGIVTALGLYYGAMLLYNTVNRISAAIIAANFFIEKVHAASTMMQAGATFAATAAQYGFNAALLACPLTWIILLIIVLIAVIYAVCAAIAKLTGIANSGFGVMTGGINVVIQFFKNLGLSVANIALGIGNAIAAVAHNIMTAFHNAICSVQAWWYDMLSTVLDVIAWICEALNKLPFIEFDYSGITEAADNYAAKSAEAAGNKEEYESITDAFNEGFNTFDTFQDGWVSDAFNSGAAWGDGVVDNISSAIDNFFGSGTKDMPSEEGDDWSSIYDGVDSIAGNTDAIADDMEITEEDLRYLRDIAEQEVVNRFTTAEISVDMSGMNNNISNGMDLDGVILGLTEGVNEAVDSMAEGVHV